MAMKRLLVAGIAGAILMGAMGSARAANLLIDDFSQTNPSQFFIIGDALPAPFHPNDTPIEQSGLPTTIGDERDTLVEVMGTPLLQSAQFLIGVDAGGFPSGVFRMSTAANPGTRTTLQYDGDDSDGASLVNAQLLDVALSTAAIFELDFLSVDAPGSPSGLPIDILLTSIGGGSASYSDFAPESAAPFTFTAAIADFVATPEFDSQHVSSMTFVFNNAALVDVDFTLDNINAVPEPATCMLGALGAAAAFWMARRRRAS